MSFHFPQVFPLISDQSVWHNGKHPEALDKSSSSFQVTAAPALRLVIPVCCRQTGFLSVSINFYEKPMIKTEPTGCKESMAAKGPGEEIVQKRLTILCLVLFLYSIMSMIHTSISQLLSSLSHQDRYFRISFTSVCKSTQKYSELRFSLPIYLVL